MLSKFATPLRASGIGSPMASAQSVLPRRKSFLSSIAEQLTPRRSGNSVTEKNTPFRRGSMAWTPGGRGNLED